jgi:aspartate/methionine/tyrosine aminotransferase
LVDLCQAVPDYPPHPDLSSYLADLMKDPDISRYTPDEGLADVRASVSDWYQRRYTCGPSADEICLTIGASQAFWLAMVVLCQAGDEVIVQSPAYFDHPMGLQALGIKPVYSSFDPMNPEPDPDRLAALITSKTRALLLVTPSNPTGYQIAPAALKRLFEFCSERNIALVLDETYNAFAEGAPHTLFTESDWSETLIQVASFGKTFSLTGFRAGALVAGQQVLRQALKVQDSMAVCQPKITQRAIQYGCDHLDQWVDDNARMMRKRHDHFCEIFDQPENSFQLVSSGGFFAWVKHPWSDLNSRQAVRKLLDKAGVITLPGAAFGPGLEPHLRLAFGNIREDEIPAAIARIIHLGD